jgi:hypothetical protein
MKLSLLQFSFLIVQENIVYVTDTMPCTGENETILLEYTTLQLQAIKILPRS